MFVFSCVKCLPSSTFVGKRCLGTNIGGSSCFTPGRQFSTEFSRDFPHFAFPTISEENVATNVRSKDPKLFLRSWKYVFWEVHTLVHHPHLGPPSTPRQNFKLVEKRNQKHDPEIISDTWTWADAMYGQILLTNESHKKYCRLIQKAKDLRYTCILLHIINIIIMKLHCCTDRSLRAAINKYKHFGGRNLSIPV